MAFLKLAPFAIVVTSYEEVGNKLNPTISHVFWGQNYQEALGNASSHLKTDVFFSSTFVGTLPLKNSTLYLAYNGEFIGMNVAEDINATLDMLKAKAEKVNEKQHNKGIIQSVQMLFAEDHNAGYVDKNTQMQHYGADKNTQTRNYGADKNTQMQHYGADKKNPINQTNTYNYSVDKSGVNNDLYTLPTDTLTTNNYSADASKEKKSCGCGAGKKMFDTTKTNNYSVDNSKGDPKEGSSCGCAANKDKTYFTQ
jgi:hypothetical protein